MYDRKEIILNKITIVIAIAIAIAINK